MFCRIHHNPNDPSQRILLIQVAEEITSRVMTQRTLEFLRNEQQYDKGAWKPDKTGLRPGVYCEECLKEPGTNIPVADDFTVQFANLDDPPLLFCSAEEFRLDKIWQDLQDQFSDKLVMWEDFPARPPVYGDLAPEVDLNPNLRSAIFGRLLPSDGQLYRHQVEAIDAVYRGENVTVVTATASGKTLTYLLPVVDAVLKNPQATALYLAPLNALVEDQLDAFSAIDDTGRDWEHMSHQDDVYKYCRRLELGGRSIKIARYHGGMPDSIKKDIRATRPNIVITNPEMLHWGILSWAVETHWQYLFENLRYVVIDEIHTYKGIFGSNFANLIRRLRRLCHYMGASPQFICASATISNPAELAEALTGRPHTIIGPERDGAPRKLRRFVLWDATRSDEAINTDAKNLVQRLIGQHRIKTIAFARSISSVDAIYRYVASDLRDKFGKEVTLIQEFKRALKSDEKREIAQSLREGRLQGVISTTALKLGIDIGDLSAAVIVKYPGSIADVWQQSGRAGRKGEGLIVLMLDRDPLNQYFARNPADFFEMEAESVFVDPDNKYILLDQLWCATKDYPVDQKVDRQFFGDSLPEYLTMLDKEGKLLREQARNVWVLRDRNGFPAAEVPIRAVGFSLPVVDDRGKEVAQEDTSRATRYLHKYAYYSIQDDIYEVTEFSLDLRRKQGRAKVRKVRNPKYITASVSQSDSSVISTSLKRAALGLELFFGDIEFRSQVYAYYKIPLGGRDRQSKAEFQHLGKAAPPERVFETTAIWFTLPPKYAKQFDVQTFEAGLRSMAKALASAVTIQEFCDPADVDALYMVEHPDTGQPTIFIHDTVPGGIGIAEQTLYDFESVFRQAYRILKECPNAANDPDHLGCPLCVTEMWGEENVVNRPVAIAMMEEMLAGDPVVERKSDIEVKAILEKNGFADLEFIKAGGMGKIYRGRRNGQDLAIKILNPIHLGLSPEVPARMIQEASIWKKLVHQNIVRLQEAQELDGLLYLAMDYMPRGSLSTRIPGEGMDLAEARRIALGLAKAVAYLAERGYVHRDIKPDNILFDPADQPRLTDFGIAKSVDDEFWQRTRAGVALGTEGYWSPEQRRDAASCTSAADIFALGVVLYEMLTGNLPGRDTPGAVVEETFLDERLPATLIDILRQMLATDPAQRPSVAKVIEILEAQHG